MGGYGCGGQNRRHDCVGRYMSLDSFNHGKHIPRIQEYRREYLKYSVSWKNGSSIGIELFEDYLIASYYSGGEKIRDYISFDRVPNNYGGADRVYFSCPYCGRRSRLLYCHNKHFKCRICARLNYASQQLTKGTEQAVFRIRKLLRGKFNDPADSAPIDLDYYVPPRPKGMHQRTYDRLIDELERLQEESSLVFMAKAMKIIKRAGMSLDLLGWP